MGQSDFVDWLLDARTPSLRYLTLRYLLDYPEHDSKVQAARQEMTATGPIPAILAKQTPSGCWMNEHDFYTPKFTATHWTMLLLVELAADPQDIHLKQGAAFMLETHRNWRHDHHPPQFQCLPGNILRYVLYAGLEDDTRTQTMMQELVEGLRNSEHVCTHNHTLPCAWGVVRALWGLAAAQNRTPEFEEALQQAVKFLLEDHTLHEANYPVWNKINPTWFKLNALLFYQADILFVLRVLAELNMLTHPAVEPALDWLQSKRQDNGRWQGVNAFRSRTWALPGGVEETGRWVSFHAALILKKASRLN